MRRFGRRLDVEPMMAELPIRAFFLDCLMLESRALLERETHRDGEDKAADEADTLDAVRRIAAAQG